MTVATVENVFPFPILVACTEKMPENEWRELRKPFLGGSDASAAIGMNKWKGPIGVFYDKTMELPDKAEGNERLRQKFRSGHKLEPVIADIFAEETGLEVLRQPYFYQHPTYKFMAANIDFAVREKNSEISGLECKNSAFRADWKDGKVPEMYYIQCQHYMAVTNAKRWYLAFMLEGWEFDFVTIERDDDMIAAMIQMEESFWYNHIVPRIPPLFDGSEDAKQLLGFLYPKENGETVELGEEFDTMWTEKASLSAQIHELEKRQKEIDNQIKAAIGSHEFAKTPRSIIKFVTVDVKGKQVDPYSYRRMYRKELAQ